MSNSHSHGVDIPPAPNDNVRNVPRVFSASQDPATLTKFLSFYPNGLPITYQMVQRNTEEGGVSDTYTENFLPVGFYTQTPRDAQAIISTERGTRRPRCLAHILPERHVHLWSSEEVQLVCNSLRLRYWDLMESMPSPQTWSGLYYFFDAHDLYHYGALNLWNVINHLVAENHILSHEVEALKMMEIGRWADRWLSCEENKDKLLTWTVENGPAFDLLSSEDVQNLGPTTNSMTDCLSNALIHRRSLLLQVDSGIQRWPANNLASARATGKWQNWLGKRTKVVAYVELKKPLT